jgi:hypothetical protein
VVCTRGKSSAASPLAGRVPTDKPSDDRASTALSHKDPISSRSAIASHLRAAILRKPLRIFRLLLVPDSSLKEPPGLKGTGPVPFYRQGRNNLLQASNAVNAAADISEKIFRLAGKPVKKSTTPGRESGWRPIGTRFGAGSARTGADPALDGAGSPYPGGTLGRPSGM